MPAWYDLLSLDATGKQDEKGIRNACDQCIQLFVSINHLL